MMYIFGPHIPDVNPPEFAITEPRDGAVFVAPVDFSLRGSLDDELHPQFYSIQVFLDDQPVADPQTNIRVDLRITNPPPGEYNLKVVVVDEAGNAAEDSVQFTILEEGSELPEDEDPDEPSGTETCRVGGAPHGAWLLLLCLGWVRRPR
jgi:hypothetical protein